MKTMTKEELIKELESNPDAVVCVPIYGIGEGREDFCYVHLDNEDLLTTLKHEYTTVKAFFGGHLDGFNYGTIWLEKE